MKNRRTGAVLAIGLALLPGCGAMFHSSQSITLATPPANKAMVYQGGLPLTSAAPGEYKATVFLNTPMGEMVAVAPGKKVQRIQPERHVDGIAILCDALLSLTIIGIAAPISDALLGTFVKTESRTEVVLTPDVPGDNPMPVYSIEGTTVTASEEAAPAPAASSQK